MAISPKDVTIALQCLNDEQSKELVYLLGVPLHILDTIEGNYKGNMRKIHYVQAWFDHEVETSWEKITDCLKLMGLNALAGTIATKHCSSKTSTSTDTTSDLPSPRVSDTNKNSVTSSYPSTDPEVRPLSHSPPPPSPSTPPAPPSPPASDRGAQVKTDIEKLSDTFFNIISDTQSEMSLKESVDPSFLKKVVDRLLALPVAQKAPHVKFFRDSEDDFLKAENVRKLIAILKRYCNCFNYEIMQEVVRKFCAAMLQHRMQEYCQSLEMFERGTTVDIYLEAISAGPVLSSEFTKMAVTINKPANQCTLYEVRKLKEAAAERASLQPYSVYIGDISVSSVKVELAFPASCVGWILGAMTPDFLALHHLSQVVLGQDCLAIVDRPITELNDELMKASKSGDLVRVTSLLNSGADVHTLDEDESYRTPLIYASKYGYLDMVRLLISRGAQPNSKNEFDSTALMFAAWKGITTIVRELLSLGADPNAQNINGDTAVILATARNQMLIKELVKAYSDLNLQNEYGLTALMIAVRGGKTELVNILLEGDGIDIDIQENTGGWTALHLSAENGDSATTHALIRAGANVHIKAKNGWTALEIAEVKSVDKDTELIPPWFGYYSTHYRGERDYEMVIKLLRGNIPTLPITFQEKEVSKKAEESDVKDKVEEEEEVKLKREWMRWRRREGRGREIVEKTTQSMGKPSDKQTSSSTTDE